MKTLVPAFVLLLAFCVLSASAATYTINSSGTGDFATIQDAILNMVANDVLLLEDGIYTGVGNREITTLGLPIGIASLNGPANCTVDLQNSYQGFLLFNGESPGTVIEGIMFINGSGNNGGAINITNTSPTIRGCVFRNNDATIGGGVFTTGSSSLIEDCLFESNTSESGAGISVSGGGGGVTVRNCRFLSNDGFPRGGGISFSGSSSSIVESCEFFDNNARDGGAAYVASSSPEFRYCLFIRNTAVVNGGAFHFQSANAPSIISCTMYDNEAGQFGSGVHTRQGSSVSIENTIIASGRIADAVHCVTSGIVSLSCSNVFGNQGGDYVDCLAGLEGSAGNFSLDSEFCDAGGDDFTLHSDSPCVPGNHPDGALCALIGALDVACGATTAVEQTSWGEVKGMFR